ncbi:MAG: MarR family winged helix-turn-helix transcriptional regulator [Actinomycetota bacterium]|nr:MarR family winged helix-turn-helix transcriptional regulator [Actinomycetota bacterium]
MELDDLVYLGQQLVRAGRMAMHETRPNLQAAESAVIGELLAQRFSTITELASRTGYAQSRISKAVAALREQGLVGTRVDQADRRRSVVYLLDSAEEAASRESPTSGDQVLRELLGGVDVLRRAEIVAAVQTLVDAVRQPRRAGSDSEVMMRRWAEDLQVPPTKLEGMTSRQVLELLERRRSDGDSDAVAVSPSP